MNDARMSEELISWERSRDAKAFERQAHAGVATGRPRGVLTAEQAAARREQIGEATAGELAVGDEGVSAGTAVPAHEASADPAAPMRALRLGGAAVVFLVLLLLWIRQRRNGT